MGGCEFWVRTVPGVLSTFYVQMLGVHFPPVSLPVGGPHARQSKEGLKSAPQVSSAQLMSGSARDLPWEQAIDLLPGFPHPSTSGWGI